MPSQALLMHNATNTCETLSSTLNSAALLSGVTPYRCTTMGCLVSSASGLHTPTCYTSRRQLASALEISSHADRIFVKLRVQALTS